jgi:hypothetical protein
LLSVLLSVFLLSVLLSVFLLSVLLSVSLLSVLLSLFPLSASAVLSAALAADLEEARTLSGLTVKIPVISSDTANKAVFFIPFSCISEIIKKCTDTPAGLFHHRISVPVSFLTVFIINHFLPEFYSFIAAVSP